LKLIVIGASTGGPKVLGEILTLLPPLRASVVIVQHMPAFINPSFVRTLARQACMDVRLAQEGDALDEGVILVAPSDFHLTFVRNRCVRLGSGPQVNYVRPAIDVAMMSLLPPGPGQKIIGVVLTGMGRDGAAGLAHIKRLGGMTVAQDEASCAVWGMPAQAVKLGCVDYELPPASIVALLTNEAG
jgi:two-component system chemotaxis response regulator CheB